MASRRIALALLLCAACTRGEQHAVEVELEPGEFAVVAVLDGEALEVATLVDGQATRIDFPQGSLMFVWRFAAGDLVDRGGRPLDDEALAAAVATTEPTTGCGRCTFEALTSPQRVAPGDVCHVPVFAQVEAYENNGGPSYVEVPTMAEQAARRVFVAWPGDCPCDEDRPLRELSSVEITSVEPRRTVATRSGRLFDDGRIIGVSTSHSVTIDAEGLATVLPFDRPIGIVRAQVATEDGLLIAMTDPKPSSDNTIYRVVTHEGALLPRFDLPSMAAETMFSGPDGRLYVAGRTAAPEVTAQVFSCEPVGSVGYACTEEPLVSDGCDPLQFRFSGGVTTTGAAPTVAIVGNHGELLVRDASTAEWSCHPGLSQRQYFHDTFLYDHDFVEDFAVAPDGRLNLCSRGYNASDTSSVLWSVDLSDVQTIEGLPAELEVTTLSTTFEACHSLSVDPASGRVRTIFGFGETVVDVVGAQVTGRSNGIGQPWDGPTPDLLREVHGPVLDLLEVGDYKLAVTADRSLFRRGPDGDTYQPVYTTLVGKRGPLGALTQTRPGTIAAFGSGVKELSRIDGVVVQSRLDIDFPTGNTLADVAAASPDEAHRVVVATHEAPRRRCTQRGTTKIPCPPSQPDRVDVHVVDLTEERVIDRLAPPVDDPAIFVAAAALAPGVFVFLDREGRVFAIIDRAFVQLEVKWDDPSTKTIETRVADPVWTDLEGRDGVAWLVGSGLVGRVAWRRNRTLVVEAFWHARLGAPLGAVVPKSLDLWCADRGIVMGVSQFDGTTFTSAIHPWVLGREPTFCNSADFALCPFPERSAGELRFHTFSKPQSWVTPLGALRFEGGGVAFLYDDGTVEPRGGPATATPFTYVTSHAVTDGLVLIGGEGQRVVSVTPP